MTGEADLDETIVHAVLRAEYGVTATALTRLSGGLDRGARAFRVGRNGLRPLVLRMAERAPTHAAVLIPRHLRDVDVEAVVAPVRAQDGQLVVHSHGLAWTLSPYIDGEDGWTHGMDTTEWAALGAALKVIHGAVLPPEIVVLLRRDGFDAAAYLASFSRYDSSFSQRRAGSAAFVAAWSTHRGTVTAMLDQMVLLSGSLRTKPRPEVVCHGDLHPGNVLVATDGLHVIDWDEIVLAPRERDFIFVPGLASGDSRPGISDPKGEAFLEAYDPVTRIEVDWIALTYYRCERVLQDVLVEAGRARDEVPDDENGPTVWLGHFFQPGGEGEAAIETAQQLPPRLNRLGYVR